MKNILAKLALIGFGTLLGLLTLVVALQVLKPSNKGTEFNSTDDVRKAMLATDTGQQSNGSSNDGLGNEGNGPVSLRAIVYPHPSDRIIYTLKPNLNLRFVRAQVTTNSCALRGPEISVPKPPGVTRIAVLGDSFAFGYGVEHNQAFPHIIEEELNKRAAPGHRFEVLNFGVPGYSPFQEVALFLEKGFDFQPDVILLYFVQNDFGMPFFIRDLSGSTSILSSLEFVNVAKKLLSDNEVDQKVKDLGLDPNRALLDLSAAARAQGVPVFVALNPHKHWKKDYKRLWALRNEPGLSFIPLSEELTRAIKDYDIPEADLTLSYDPHPSPIRHKLLGQILASNLWAAIKL